MAGHRRGPEFFRNFGSVCGTSRSFPGPPAGSSHTPDASSRTATGSSHTADDSSHTVDGSSHTADDSSHTVDGSSHTADDSSHMVDSSSHTAGGSNHTADASSHTNKSFIRTVFGLKHARDGKNHALLPPNPKTGLKTTPMAKSDFIAQHDPQFNAQTGGNPGSVPVGLANGVIGNFR